VIGQKVFEEHPVRVTIAILCVLLFIGVRIKDFYTAPSVSGWNEKEISRVKVPHPEDFTFAVLGDNKGNRSYFEPLLRDMDQNSEIAFAIDVGDLVDGGQEARYRRFFNQLHENLKIPFLSAIGNHDLYRSSGTYRKIFGPTYDAFQVGHAYFLVLEATTESGFDKAERQWLEEELQKSQATEARFVFMHVPPFDPRGSGFNKCLPEKDGKDLLGLFNRYNVTHLFASHIHGYFTGVWEGISYTITGGGGAALQGSDPQHFFHHYVRVHVNNGNVATTVRRIDPENVMKRFFYLMEDFVLEWGLLAVAGICLLTLGLSVGRSRGSRSHRLKG
jgi:serine/threonine-protein phosphatase CPPED1